MTEQLGLYGEAAGALERTAEHLLRVILNTILLFTGMLPILFWYVLV